jgi:hypothetical protein
MAMNVIDGCGSDSLTSKYIKGIMDNNSQFSIGRMPGIEADVLSQWARNGLNTRSINTGLLEQNAGFYSQEHNYYDVLEYWCKLYLEGLRQCDLLFRLETHTAASFDFLVKDFHENIHIWSAVRLHQWMPFLADKKILIISPFEDSINMQWKNRHNLFTTGKIPFEFPEFELSTINSHNTIKGNEPFPCSNWRESFESMCSEIDEKDFDVAVLGCGSYGMPLANYIKQMGRGSLYVGAYVQIMFGIKGARWTKHTGISSYFSEFWKAPEEHEKPKTYKSVEGGCYWL